MEFPLNKCILRPWIAKDSSDLALHANNKKIADNLRDGFPHPYTLKDAEIWLKNVQLEKNLLLAIEVNKVAVGSIGLFYKDDVYKRTAEIGYWLSEDFWNQGIMTESVKAIVDFTFNNTEIIKIYAGIFKSNKASAKVLEKCGFHLEAIHKKAVLKKGEIIDELFYTIFNDD